MRPRVLPRELTDVDVPFELFLPLFVRACPELGSKQPKVLVVSRRQENGLPLLFLRLLFFLLFFLRLLSSFCSLSFFSCSLFALCNLPSPLRGCICLLENIRRVGR